MLNLFQHNALGHAHVEYPQYVILKRVQDDGL